MRTAKIEEITPDAVPNTGDLITGRVYKRKALHERFGGNQNKGIVPSKKEPVVLIFHTEEKIQQFYDDGFNPAEGIYWYSGEGTNGNMKWGVENCAIRDHEKNNKDIYLLERAQRKGGLWRVYGLMKYIGFKNENRPGKDGKLRNAFVFSLMPIAAAGAAEPGQIYDVKAGTDSLAKLRAAALENPGAPEKRKSVQQVYERSEKIKKYALARAAGRCELCGADAPFLTRLNTAYLEVHHISRLADEGLEAIDSVAAICPNCHRRCHYGLDAVQYNLKLKNAVSKIELNAKEAA